jgi:hypothetical protein
VGKSQKCLKRRSNEKDHQSDATEKAFSDIYVLSATFTGNWRINDLQNACKRGNAAYAGSQWFQVEHDGSPDWNPERGDH